MTTRVVTLCEANLNLAASGEGADALPSFDMVAYTGNAIRQFWSEVPLVVDLNGLDVSRQKRPVKWNHWGSIGHTTGVVSDGRQLTAAGVVSRDTGEAKDFVASARKGFPWQASIGADVLEIARVKAGDTVEVNGRQFNGPIDVIRRAQLLEISVVELGADQDTATVLKAMHANLEKSYPMLTGSGTQQNPPTPAPVPTPAPNNNPAPTPAPAPAPDLTAGVQAYREAIAAEQVRIASINAVYGDKFPDLKAKAIGEGWDATKAELEFMRKDRPVVGVHAGHAAGSLPGGVSPWQVIEAGLCAAGRLAGAEEAYADPVLQAAHSQWGGRLGLQEMLLAAAHLNGYRGQSFRRDPRGVLMAAFSSRDISGLLSNVANKFLLAGWSAVESAWKEIAAVRPVSDFKEITSYRMTGNMKYAKVGADGEIEHGDLGDESYTNKADTYAKMLAITRQDMINDDLGALSDVPRMLGRGAALKFNDVFWKEFMDNSAFFASGNNNYKTGVTAGTNDSRLNIEGLTRADQAFLDQTDSEGNPLGVKPAILLTPNALKVTAWALLNSTEVRDTTSNKATPVANPFAGMYRPVSSSHLGNSSYTGYSSLAWYLLADPADLAAIEAVFLNGQETPTIETAEADFSTLGVQMRGYHDYGVRKQEPRAGVKSKGEA